MLVCFLPQGYASVHGFLAMVVCVLGTLFNLANIMVLTHKDMRTNPINLILTGIAVADCLVMVEYIPFTVHMDLLSGDTRAQQDKVSTSQSSVHAEVLLMLNFGSFFSIWVICLILLIGLIWLIFRPRRRATAWPL